MIKIVRFNHFKTLLIQNHLIQTYLTAPHESEYEGFHCSKRGHQNSTEEEEG